MALTEIPSELSSTPSIVDNGNATAITIDASENVTFSGTLNGISTTKSASGNRWGILPEVESNGVMEVGRYLDFHSTDGDTSDYGARLDFDGTDIVSTNAFRMASGIYLGGTGAPNKLTDYETGSWSPLIRRVDGDTGASINTHSGSATYTKIGNMVNVNAFINSISAGSSNGSSYWVIYNIPFAPYVIDYTGGILAYNNTQADSVYVGDAGGNAILVKNASPYSGTLTGGFMFNITFRVTAAAG